MSLAKMIAARDTADWQAKGLDMGVKAQALTTVNATVWHVEGPGKRAVEASKA